MQLVHLCLQQHSLSSLSLQTLLEEMCAARALVVPRKSRERSSNQGPVMHVPKAK